MNRMIRDFRERWTRTQRPSATLRIACTLSLALAACGDVGPEIPSTADDGSQSSRLGAEQDAGQKSVASTTLQACVEKHVAQRGSAQAVTTLACAGSPGAACDPAPDLSPLARLENLTSLDLSHRCISDVRPLAKLTKLEGLELQGNRIEDITPLGALKELRSLGLANNDISVTWGYGSKKPFSELTRLEELNLDETSIHNILPLETLTSLRVLHMRDAEIYSLRPLRTLTNLRELHVERNMLEDLGGLEGLTQLEVLTADRNYISSTELLQRLAAKGRLRKVSLDETCVTTCEAAGVAEFSCAKPMGACSGHGAAVPAGALSVPAAFVEQYAAGANFPVWTDAQVESAFEMLITSSILWPDPRSNCNGRAREATSLLAEAGYPRTTKVHAFGNLRPLTEYDPAGFVGFDWHVAVAVRTATGFVVFDRTFAPRPIALRDWYARLVDSRGVELNYSCRDFHSIQSETYCDRIPVDERGNLLVDDPEDVRGTICLSPNCEP